MTQRIYISDTNIWIDFGRAGLLDALFDLPFTYVSTDFVIDELTFPDPEGLRQRGLVSEGLSEAEVAALFGLMAEHNNSSLADVSCYLLAKTKSLPLLTGGGRLRKQAQRDGLQVHGALWLLDQLIEHGVLMPPAAAVALQTMRDAGARLPEGECARRLSLWQAG